MKNTQRLFALLLAVVMVLSMAVTAFADTTDPYALAPTAMVDQSRIIIEGAAAGVTYKVYRMLDIASIGVDAAGKEKIVYTLRKDTEGIKWKEFFTDDKYAGKYFDVNGDFVSAVSYVDGNDPHVVDPNAPGAVPNAQLIAELAAEYIAERGIKEDGSRKPTYTGTQTGDARQIGYYLMISDYAISNEEGAFRKHNVFTLGKEDVRIQEKNQPVHSIHKQVREDSAHTDGVDDGWQDHNAAEIEQSVEFKIIVDLAPGALEYEIVDQMTNFDTLTDLVVTYSGGDEAFVAEEDYHIDTNGGGDGFSIKLFKDFCLGVMDTDYITITYKACLTPDAEIAGEGNENIVKLYHGGTEVASSETKTYTYKTVVSKKNEAGGPLAGAQFVLKAGKADATENIKLTKVADTATVDVPNGDGTSTTYSNVPTYVIDPIDGKVETITTEGDSVFIICGLDSFDEYYLVETYTPNPYIIANPELIKIENTNDYTHFVTVTNVPGVDMPTTGGMGTTIIYAVGGLMVLAAVVLLVTKKRMAA